MASITHVGISYPEASYSQQEIFSAFGLRHLFWHYFNGAGIGKRHLCYPPTELVKTDAQTHHEHHFESSLRLSLKAIRDCLDRAGLEPGDVDMMTFSSSTGFTCPGMEHYIARELKMKQSMVLTAIVGMGCGASGPALRRVWDYIQLNPGHKALCVLCEITNAGYHPDKTTLDVVLSNSIFADGAAAILVTGASQSPALSVLNFLHFHDYEHAAAVGMAWSDARLRLVLPKRISELTTPMVKKMTDCLLQSGEVRREDIAQFVIHSGGASILKEAQNVLGIPDEKMKWSYHVWKNFGNMSSATAPFALGHLLKSNELRHGDYVVMVTLGAGFEADGILMRYE